MNVIISKAIVTAVCFVTFQMCHSHSLLPLCTHTSHRVTLTHIPLAPNKLTVLF